RPRLRSSLRGDCRSISGLFGKAKLAEAGRLESHRLPRVLLLALEVRFPLLCAAQNRLRVAPRGRNSGTIAHLVLLSDAKLARGWVPRARRFNAPRTI